ncbi:MAG: hypothetical protein ACOC1K_06505 [Nanoarchaeota archaeon]
MDLTKLEEAISVQPIDLKTIYKEFEVSNKEELEKMYIGNLKLIKPEFNDFYGYEILESIYQNSIEDGENKFFEELMLITTFLIYLCDYKEIILNAYIKSLGMVNFIYLSKSILDKNDKFNFLNNIYRDYKQDKYSNRVYETITQVVEELKEQMEEIDLAEVSKQIEEFNKKQK